MKIAFLNIYNGLVNRGSERTTKELASYLSRKNEIHLIQGKETVEKTNYESYIIKPLFPNLADTSFSFLRKLYLDLWSLQILLFSLRAVPFLWKQHFEIVIPVNGGWQTALCRLITWFRKSKLVIIGRAGIGRDDRWNLVWRPDTFVALTTLAYQWAKKKSNKVNIVYIPNGVNLSEFQPNATPVSLSLKPPIILCVGAFTPNKQIELTIKAVHKVKKASLLLLGKGPQFVDLKKMGETLLGKDRFTITSVLPQEMPRFYAAANLFTLVSKTGEAFGNVYLEAMATNLPVIATKDETREEIVEEAGILVDPRNLDRYAETIRTVLNKNYGDIPRKQAEKFSWEKIGYEYEKLFKKIS